VIFDPVGLFHSLQDAGLSRRTLINAVSYMRIHASYNWIISECAIDQEFSLLLGQIH
jgi:hypothetical protein